MVPKAQFSGSKASETPEHPPTEAAQYAGRAGRRDLVWCSFRVVGTGFTGLHEVQWVMDGWAKMSRDLVPNE